MVISKFTTNDKNKKPFEVDSYFCLSILFAFFISLMHGLKQI